jgi:hypothetical protein
MALCNRRRSPRLYSDRIEGRKTHHRNQLPSGNFKSKGRAFSQRNKELGTDLGHRFTKRRDCEPRILQRCHISFQRPRPPSEMHSQAIARFRALKTFRVKVIILDDKGGSGVRRGEAPAIGKRMHDLDNQHSSRPKDAPDFFQSCRNIFDTHQHVIGHDEIEPGVLER